jgi:ATP-dependent helicase/nuclease subunit B
MADDAGAIKYNHPRAGKGIDSFLYLEGPAVLERAALQTRFLLGPSGTGKTYRCLAEARKVLLAAPLGPPLVFLAPKQATYQLERQLLADGPLLGYTRLRILSFERLAEYLLTEFDGNPPRLLSGEGRLMVFRTLLSRKRQELQLFRASARLRGFAQQLSDTIRELQRSQFTPSSFEALARREGGSSVLRFKLRDLALLWQAYEKWLEAHQLQDADCLLSLAAEALRQLRGGSNSGSEARFEWLWLDGFAELAPQEMDFLCALLPHCTRATLAFNIGPEWTTDSSWLSCWSLASATVGQLRQRLTETAGAEIPCEWLDRKGPCTRFSANPILQELERTWPGLGLRGTAATDPERHSPVEPCPAALSPDATAAGYRQFSRRELLGRALRLAVCVDREAETRLAAREIRRFVRSGRRYRDTAVIVRSLENYAEPIRRVFSAYDIPLFLDRREPVGHHPLTELTRSALRTVALGWQPEDWFGALKTGLVHPDESAIDRLENEALERGWKGTVWLEPMSAADSPELEAWLEPLRKNLVAPFQQLATELGSSPSGSALAGALSVFWGRLGVADCLQKWAAQAGLGEPHDLSKVVHGTVWEQMQDWLDNVRLAFAQEKLSLRDWLPILEAGLAGQTVGVIPPALDQVLVGAVDRSRNPDLKLVVVLGLNESVFPAVPDEGGLITADEREELARIGVSFGQTTRHRMARERYLGYIACTRARERLVLTCALRDEEDAALHPSPLLDRLLQQFPELELETVSTTESWTKSEHECELEGAALRATRGAEAAVVQAFETLPRIAKLKERSKEIEQLQQDHQLSSELTEALYGNPLETSVSRLEEYAACPFRFLVSSGLRVQERKLFELDARQQGSFQHEILARFHEELAAESKRWRDLTPADARVRIRRIADELIPTYQNGLFQADERRRFIAQSLTESLESFIDMAVHWMPQYQFDPAAVELAFGIEAKPLPAWEIDLDGGHRLSFRGKIDRVDLWKNPASGEALCVVIDYKSSLRRLDPVFLANGVQLQLPAYLNVLRSLKSPEGVFESKRLLPAGVFFVNLRGQYRSGKTRSEVLNAVEEARALAYQHTGRFDVSALRQLDSRADAKEGTQFNYRLRQDGKVHSNCREAIEGPAFAALLDAVEGHLRRMGLEIYAGNAKPDPYRKGSTVACDKCVYQSICRLDPWTHAFRVLK